MTSELDSQFTTLTGARQTMSSWAQVVEAYEALPAIYKDPFTRIMGNPQIFPYVVLAPTIAIFGGRRSTEKVLIKTDSAIHILERNGNTIHALGFPVSGVAQLEYGNILIYSWITLHGVNVEGDPCVFTIEFNMSSLRHILPFIRTLRPERLDGEENVLELERSKFNSLESETYKLRSRKPGRGRTGDPDDLAANPLSTGG
jgi:hypothetical protein